MAKNKVAFDEEYCKGCELCVNVCPVKIVHLNSEKINSKGYHPATVTEMDKCVGCSNCAIICPDSVITISKS